VLTPAVRRLINEHGLDASAIIASGKDGRLTKEDVEAFLNKPEKKATTVATPIAEPETSNPIVAGSREEKRVPMTRLRKRIAERLVEVQQTSAILTTFNEVNMKPAMDLRAKYKDLFEKTHGVRLGFMSFFVKAVVEALKRFPDVNASIDGSDIIYHGYFDIGIAVSSPRGLVVPVLRDVDTLSFAGIEGAIRGLGTKAKENKLTMDDLQGGTFTVTNGGVFGSLMSTPIINPPQSAILGMHNILEKPVVENGEIVIRPMMYVALSYDHRIIDGKDSVGFLKTVKELVEDPSRLFLEV
jgi:2-oxoglutarate dehydrogenase E2 component (dihydrolipoamide succinyltransferase)